MRSSAVHVRVIPKVMGDGDDFATTVTPVRRTMFDVSIYRKYAYVLKMLSPTCTLYVQYFVLVTSR